MSEDRITRMSREMLEDLEKLSGKWIEDFQEEMGRWTQDLLKDALDPAKMMQFVRMMGIDLSRLPGMVGQQPGFDPYQVLGLSKDASEKEVKEAYKKVMDRVHPDKAGPELKFMATMANAAYDFIKKERGWQ